jgi:hypothetical protein
MDVPVWAEAKRARLRLRRLLFEQDGHSIRGLHFDDPVGPVLTRPLDLHLEAETGLLAGGDRVVSVAHAQLPGYSGCGRISVRASAQPEFDVVIAEGDEAGILRTS